MAAQADAAFLNEPRFNRTFEYTPPGGTSGPLKIKYADYGYRNEAHPEQERIMLFSGPLMGSRLVIATKDALAIKNKIRIISADRPGMGGTDPVAPKDRLIIWRGTSSLPLKTKPLPTPPLLTPTQTPSPPSSNTYTSPTCTSSSPTPAAPSTPSTSSSTTPTSSSPTTPNPHQPSHPHPHPHPHPPHHPHPPKTSRTSSSSSSRSRRRRINNPRS